MNVDNFKINLNQKLWLLLITLMTLGTAEYLGLCSLFWFGFILSLLAFYNIIFLYY